MKLDDNVTDAGLSVFDLLSRKRLSDMMWSFGAVGRPAYSSFLKLLPDRRIGGYSHPNESYWRLERAGLKFLNLSGQTTSTFNQVAFTAEGRLAFTGYLGDNPASEMRHVLFETPEPYRMCQDAGQFKIDHVATGPRRRNLVIMGANETSLHHQWPHDIADADRNWDFAISFYGQPQHYPPAGAAEYTSLQPGRRKWLALHAAFHETSPFWAYERILVMDDDILTSWRDINHFFEICRDYNLWLAQPSLKPDCSITHKITAQVPGSLLRYTSFVEAMAPCFTAEALRICIACTQGGYYGFGIDHIWPKLLGYPKAKLAIIDAIAIDHTRPLATTYPIDKAKAEEAEVLKLYDVRSPPASIRETGRIYL